MLGSFIFRLFFFSSRRRHTRCYRDWSSDVCSSDLATASPPAAPCHTALDLGLDARYALTSELALVGTINPDFGQVELDERVLNLTTFETYLPEKRPFFLEGLDLFNLPLSSAYQIFYS